ncbi:MAG TPA: hypothetical protein VG757_01955 [Devosia sp.]|nr:hypothetical protein [Devosia sp.]
MRQIFYRLVGAHDFPKTETFYGTLCHHLANARRARVIPFDAIRDDGVTTVRMEHFDDEDHFRRHVRYLGENCRRNLMATQPLHLEVWCEAAGMIHQLAAVAHRYSIRVYSSSGFDSLTAKKAIADRICETAKPAVILHLGDFDPSGESIFEAVAEDVEEFVEADRTWGEVFVNFERVALTGKQVKAFDLPTAPARATDSRSKSWSGETCQLEALTPTQIAEILEAAIERWIAPVQMIFDRRAEADERTRLTRLLAAPVGAA